MSAPTFEVLAFRALPVTSSVAVLELEGRFTNRAPLRLGRPALLAEFGRERFELQPIAGADAAAGPGGVPWRASFAVSAAALDGASFALEVGRDLVDLPAPDLGAGDRDEGERLARLAREANDLRRRLDEAAVRVAESEVAVAAAAEQAAAAKAAAEEEAARSVEAVRAQSDLLLNQAREEAEAALTAERERHEREVAAVREQANHSLATAEDEADQAIAAVKARADAERARHEREMSAVREQADVALATALREQRDELVPPRPAPGAAAPPSADRPPSRRRAGSPDAPAPGPAPGGLIAPADVAPQPAQRVRPSTAAGRLWRRDPLVTDPATAPTEVVDTGNDETVRFLSGRRRQRHSAEDEREPATLAAGATRAGARSIGSSRADGTPSRREPQRIGALIALAVAILAFVLVVVLRVGPF